MAFPSPAMGRGEARAALPQECLTPALSRTRERGQSCERGEMLFVYLSSIEYFGSFFFTPGFLSRT
jgi:hypothetical protein